MQRLVLPIVREFQPDLCVISSGFDACIGDTMGKFRISPIGYGLMVRMIVNACDANRVAVVLEGGYNLCTMPRAMGCSVYSLLKGKVKENLTIEQYESEVLKEMTEEQRR